MINELAVRVEELTKIIKEIKVQELVDSNSLRLAAILEKGAGKIETVTTSEGLSFHILPFLLIIFCFKNKKRSIGRDRGGFRMEGSDEV